MADDVEMSIVFKKWIVAAVLAPVALGWAAPVAELREVEGRVLVRAAGVQKPEPAEAGRMLAAGEALITGDASRFEVRPLAGGGVWRVGRRAVFSLDERGARLLAGTMLVQVPAETWRRVESSRSIAALPEGTWLVQATDNRGLKIVCLDGDEPVQVWGSPQEPAEDLVLAMRIRPGELVFVQPGGRSFSPAVAIFLEETLVTSRLIGGFAEPLPGMKRLVNQAIAQRERLKGVSNAVVVGASAAGVFQIAVPKAEEPVEKTAEKP